MKKMENRDNLLFHTVALVLLPSLNKPALQKIVAAYGSAQAVFEAAACKDPVPPMSASLASQIVSARSGLFRRAEQEMEYMRRNGVKSFIHGEADYPYRLAQCPDAPLVLFGRGRLPLNRPRQVAVVGTRHPTAYGRQLASRTVEVLAAYRPVIVSGLASGVDGLAHEAALSAGLPTVGVLGHGMESLFPAGHRDLQERMLERGGVVTEYVSDVPPLPRHFPPRNRIIAGLSDAVVVVEAQRRSGALITANLGFSYNREVFAYPGRLTDTHSEGCNNLIRKNKAALLMQPSELADALRWRESSAEKKASAPAALTLPLDLTDTERKVYEAIVSQDTPDADSLMLVTGLSVPELSAILLSLECKSVVRRVAGQRYRQV